MQKLRNTWVLGLAMAFASLCFGQAPITYPDARTDTLTTQPPAVMPNWGGAVGAGTVWCNPAFNNLCETRLSDSLTSYPLKGEYTSVQTADSGEPQLISADGKHILVRTTGGVTIVLSFNSKTGAVQPSGLRIGFNSVNASRVNNSLIFALEGTQIHRITVSSDWSTITNDQLYFNFASNKCLGTSFKPTWNGQFTVAGEPTTVYKTAYSNTGAQGSGTYVVSYSSATGCVVWNTITGVVTSSKTGTIGTINTADRFYLHEAGEGSNPLYALVAPTVRQPSGAPGCVTGNCVADAPYVWTIGTVQAFPCGLTNCDGHSTKGVDIFLTGHNQVAHSYALPNTPLTKFVIFPPGFPDQHGSGNNGSATNGPPFFLVSAAVPSLPVYPVWGYDEILAVKSDASGTVYRINQTLITGKSPFFICQNGVGVVSPLGDGVIFTSDMGGNGALGYEKDGVTSRCDVFWAKTSH